MKSTTLIIFALAAFVFASCSNSKKSTEESTEESASPALSLKLKWTTDTLLTTCESVIYDKERETLYVSLMDGGADVKDDKGYISKVSLSGEIIDREWISDLHAPKGLAIVAGKLYVSDIDAIVEIGIDEGTVLNKYPVEGAQFLNDVTADAAGNVYVSDGRTNSIIMLSNGEVSVFMDNVDSPNGLLVEDGNILVAYWNEQKMKSVNMESKEVTEIAEGLANPDGIEAVGDGGYLVSDWQGQVTYVSADGATEVLLDTREESVSAADIEYIIEKNLLLVPTFYGNSVMAYELVKE